MARVCTYLNFGNNTEEAFNFYKSVFGGEFSGNGISRFKDIPPSEDTPLLSEADKNLVMHVELTILGGYSLMGTDAPESMGFNVNYGNNVHISLEPDSREETKKLFDALSDGGQITMELQDMFWGAYYGSCTDKYGVQWMFNFPKKINHMNSTTQQKKEIITIEVTIETPVDKVWYCWTNPDDIIHWNSASDDWHTPKAANDLRVNGNFSYRMESKDGKMGFDFKGVYTQIIPHKLIQYKIDDGRLVTVDFESINDTIKITESFEAETEHPIEMQRIGWQSILNNFKKYVEKNN